jgi:hypothetical protein
MRIFAIGEKVLIKSKKRYGFICDDTDSKRGHYIVDCYDFMDTKDPDKYLIDVFADDIQYVTE